MMRARALAVLRLQQRRALQPLVDGSAPSLRLVSSRRGFSASSKPPGEPYEALKREFGRWVRGELLLLGAMLGIGVGGVYFYQNREGAPWKQVTRLVKEAEQAADQGDREQALKHSLHAYDVVRNTNRRDRHLFELAFGIAAQYETIGRRGPATKYYLDALEHLAELGDVEGIERRVQRQIVTFDCIAQCYEDRSQKAAAERFFKQAIAVYDQHAGNRSLSSASSRNSKSRAVDQEINREIPGVLHNYGRFLLAERRLDEAKLVLRRAFRLAKAASLADDELALIDDQLDALGVLQAAAKSSTASD